MEKFATAVSRGSVASLILLTWLSVFGCAGLGKVPDDKQILFSDRESGQGVFESGQFTANYSYTLRGDDLHVEGTAWYRGGFDSLSAYLVFIDATGAVLQRKIVYYSGYRVGHWPGTRDNSFQDELKVPAGAAGFSFRYSAEPKTIRR